MFNFFKKENRLATLIQKSFGFCFATLLIVGGAYTVIPVHTSLAEDDQNVSAEELAQIREQNRARGLTGETEDVKETGIIDGIFSIANYIQRWPNTILAFLAQVLLTIASFILWVAGVVFDVTIQYSIIKIKDFATDGGGILIVWKVFRDLANMSFIFILLYAAIQTILDIGGVQIQKVIKNIVIAALLINFSLFFTQIVINASNIVAVAFYNQIIETKCVSGNQAQVSGSISKAFMCKLGITSIIPEDIATQFGPSVTDGIEGTFKLLTYGVAGSILILIIAFVFFASAMMFLVRFLKLIKALVMSPIAFASIAVPNSKMFATWQKDLLENCLIAPIYMAATWAALIILGQMGGTRGSILQAIIGDSNGKPAQHAGETFVNFAITVSIMAGILFIADKFGGAGAGSALKALKSAGTTTGAWLARNSAGRFGAFTDKKLEGMRGMDTRAGRVVREFTTGKLANSKFGGGLSRIEDAKKVKELQTDIANKADQRRDKATLASAAAATMGTPEYADLHEKAAEILERATPKEIDSYGYKTLLPHIDKLKPAHLEHVVEKSEKFTDREKSGMRDARFKSIPGNLDAVTDATRRADLVDADPAATPAQKATANAERDAAIKTAKDSVKNLSPKEIELMDRNVSTRPDFIAHLKSSQVESIMKSDKYTGGFQNKIKEGRIRPFTEALEVVRRTARVIAGGPEMTRLEAAFKNLSNKEVAGLKDTDIQDPRIALMLEPKHLKEIQEEKDTLVRTEIGRVIKTWSDAQIAAGGKAHMSLKYMESGPGRAFFGL